MSFSDDERRRLKALGRAFREAREEAGLTQREVARRSKLGVATISRIERGLANPRLTTMRQWESGVGVSLAKTLDRASDLYKLALALGPQPGLGEAIKTVRKRQGMTQATLGKRAKLHPTWISHIESGRVHPTWGNFRRIAYSLGVRVPDLARYAMKLEGEPEPLRKVRRRKPKKFHHHRRRSRRGLQRGKRLA